MRVLKESFETIELFKEICSKKVDGFHEVSLSGCKPTNEGEQLKCFCSMLFDDFRNQVPQPFSGCYLWQDCKLAKLPLKFWGNLECLMSPEAINRTIVALGNKTSGRISFEEATTNRTGSTITAIAHTDESILSDVDHTPLIVAFVFGSCLLLVYVFWDKITDRYYSFIAKYAQEPHQHVF